MNPKLKVYRTTISIFVQGYVTPVLLECVVSRLLCNLFSMPIQKIKVLAICTVPKNPRQMIIIVGGEPDVHGAAWHAKRKGGVYAHP